jgi:hypothetical protein
VIVLQYTNSKVLRKFANVAVEKGGAYWFTAANAVLVIKEASTQRVGVLAIDGATIEDETIHTRAADCVDYSAMRPRPSNVHDRAIAFIQQRSGLDIYFEVVLDELPRESLNGTDSIR